MEYSQHIAKQLKSNGIRVEIDDRSEKIGKKIRDTELARVPYMLVVGEKEMNENAVSLRIQGQGDQGSVPLAELVTRMREAIVNRVG